MLTWVAALGALFAVAGVVRLRPIAAPQAVAGECTVERVIDGDTFTCARGSTLVTVRLLGIDAPELAQRPWGRQSSAHLARLLPRRSVVRLDLDVRERDRYGRVLAYAWSDSGMVNERMLRAGLAVVYVQPPNVKYADDLRAAARAARAEGSGLWSTPAFDCTPADYRQRRCR